MAQTIYAAFADPSLAEKAAGALMDYGVQKQDISLVTATDFQRDEATSFMNDEEARMRYGGQAWNNTGGAIEDPLGPGYSRSASADTVSEYQSGGGSRDYGTSATTLSDENYDEMETDEPPMHHHGTTEIAAKSGLSTTTPADAGAGAAKGAGIGLGVGVVVGLASLFIPGVGFVLGGGTLATALAAAAATSAAGAVAGGVTGYLKDQGMPDEAIQRYHGAMEQGGAILAVSLPSGSVDEVTATQILNKYGAGDAYAH